MTCISQFHNYLFNFIIRMFTLCRSFLLVFKKLILWIGAAGGDPRGHPPKAEINVVGISLFNMLERN